MKVRSTIPVYLYSEGDPKPAVFTFKKPKAREKIIDDDLFKAIEENPAMDPQEKLRLKTEKLFERFLERCTDVKDLEGENGPITLQNLQDLETNIDLLWAILKAYNEALEVSIYSGKAPETQKNVGGSSSVSDGSSLKTQASNAESATSSGETTD